MDAPGTFAGALDGGAERSHGMAGIEHVVAFEQPRDAGLPHRERAEDQGPVRDRFVAGHAHAALERTGTAGSERDTGGAGHKDTSQGRVVLSRGPGGVMNLVMNLVLSLILA